MEACISICPCAKSAIHRSSHLIHFVEFSPTNSMEDEGNLFIHSNPLHYVHIIDMSVNKLLMVEGLLLLHLLSATDGNAIAVRGHRNIIVCRIADRPPDLMQWWHEGWRPRRVLWSIVTRAWTRASVGWARWECSLHSTQQLLHPG
jgi:hypothetical protein